MSYKTQVQSECRVLGMMMSFNETSPPSLTSVQQQLYFFFFHPKIYKKEKFIIIVQTMIGALAARNNLRVKNARQPVLKYPLVFVTFLFLSHGYSFDFTVWNTFWLKFNSLHLKSQAWGKNAYFDVNRHKMYCVWKWCPTENHCFVSFS